MWLTDFFKKYWNYRKSNTKKLIFDFNFKLAVIESLLDKNPSFINEITDQKSRLLEFYESGDNNHREKKEIYTSQAISVFKELKFTQDDLDKVDKIIFDGSLEIYQLIVPEWDAEDSRFNIDSVKGIEYLHNLKLVIGISLINRSILNEIKKMGIQVV